jgi:hypothetical protein
MVTTRFATGRAKFTRLDVFKQGPGEVSGRRGQQGKQAVEEGIENPRNYRQRAVWGNRTAD